MSFAWIWAASMSISLRHMGLRPSVFRTALMASSISERKLTACRVRCSSLKALTDATRATQPKVKALRMLTMVLFAVVAAVGTELLSLCRLRWSVDRAKCRSVLSQLQNELVVC